MKSKMMLCVLLVLALPAICFAQDTVEVYIQGTVGDYATLSRVYELNGQIYDFPNTITLVDTAGNALPFDRIKSGSVIKVIGDQTIGGSQSSIKWKKIILIQE